MEEEDVCEQIIRVLPSTLDRSHQKYHIKTNKQKTWLLCGFCNACHPLFVPLVQFSRNCLVDSGLVLLYAFVFELGCGILLAEMALDDEKKNRSTALLQSLNMLVQTEGKERSGSEYRGLLEQHGFSKVKIKLTGNLLDVVLCIKV